MPWKNETIILGKEDKVEVLDAFEKQKKGLYLDSGKLITVQEMEEALYDARTLINKLGTEEADKWLGKVFKP